MSFILKGYVWNKSWHTGTRDLLLTLKLALWFWLSLRLTFRTSHILARPHTEETFLKFPQNTQTCKCTNKTTPIGFLKTFSNIYMQTHIFVMNATCSCITDILPSVNVDVFMQLFFVFFCFFCHHTLGTFSCTITAASCRENTNTAAHVHMAVRYSHRQKHRFVHTLLFF